MNCRVFVSALFCTLLLTTGLVHSEEKEFHLKLSLDSLFDLDKTWSLTSDDIEKQFSEQGFRENPFLHWASANHVASFSRQPFSNISVDLSALDGSLQLDEGDIVIDDSDNKARQFSMSIAKAGPEDAMKLRGKLDALLGVKSKPGPRPALGWKSEQSLQSEVWLGDKAIGLLQRSDQGVRLAIGRAGTEPSALIGKLNSRSSRSRALEFFVRIDDLLRLPKLWSMTPDDLEKALSTEGIGMKESPFYKWSTTTRESARFSRDLFSNTSTDVLLFDDAVNAEEANLEFKNGKASRLVVTLLTRGNSGRDLTAAQFDAIFKATGRSLGATLGVRPTRSTVSGKQIVKTEGWLWTTPHTLALLEHNPEAPSGKVEFLRLTITPAAARRELLNLAGIGNNATTLSRDQLKRSIKRDPATGDVEITGIPMRDQGQKGYCVAASCERLFRYLGQPTDMDEIAQVIGTDADRGTSPTVMYNALKKIDQRYNMRVKLLKIPEGYGLGPNTTSRTELERAHRAVLAKIIQENIDQGLPLLWCVALAPGETGLSPGAAGQARRMVPMNQRVGHMRLITGYNPKTGGVIYTDSWGAGHERKVMSRDEATEMTTAVFSMAPSR